MNPEPMTDDLFAQASAWHFRLQADDACAGDHARFAAWLACSQAHQEAWDEAQALLTALSHVAAKTHPCTGVRAGSARECRNAILPKRRRVAAWATAAAVVLVTGLFWQTPWAERLRADQYTAVGETRNLTLADGSHIQLDTDAALSISLAGSERRVRLLRGQAWFEVAHDGRPFIVDSGQAHVQVLGTQFSVARQGEQTLVRLQRGSISASAGAGQPVILSPGQQVDINASQLSAVSTFDPAVAFAWRQRQLVLRQQPLSDVVAQLNRYWPGHVFLGSDPLGKRLVSGVFDLDKPAAVLNALVLTQGLRIIEYTPWFKVLAEQEPATEARR